MDGGVEQALLCWFLKAALLISDARVASRAVSVPDSGINRWFGLETQHNDCFQELEEDIAEELANKQPFQLRIRTLLLPSYSDLAGRQCTLFYDRDTPLGKVSVNVPRSIRAILLEEWTFALDPILDVEPGVNDNYAQTFQHGAALIRSLYSLLRVMPAWCLYRNLNLDKSMQLTVEAGLSSKFTDKDVLKLGELASQLAQICYL
ncbi:hypothetical protein FRC08_002120 [Ceratobasidium sp. 394]|nr:hypothetical protein FRC08_002120 [Ceratobasidium sp. 394]